MTECKDEWPTIEQDTFDAWFHLTRVLIFSGWSKWALFEVMETPMEPERLYYRSHKERYDGDDDGSDAEV